MVKDCFVEGLIVFLTYAVFLNIKYRSKCQMKINQIYCHGQMIVCSWKALRKAVTPRGQVTVVPIVNVGAVAAIQSVARVYYNDS